ncbi:DUF3300 domain-containing protein [Roseomonas sp. AR75]|jgi:hypothetical protein|uniref:DUF3300 domain-containing protein n=1 Tax=Roseomonas sp. AR75 TaxID=2562311 RepID=UPI0010C12A4C|nr:DUF3300 domain-containing protein [Roseomonas sp. AR75]
MSGSLAVRGAVFAAVMAAGTLAAPAAQADWRGRPGWGYAPPRAYYAPPRYVAPRAYYPPPAYRGYYPGAGLALGAIVGLGIGAAIASQPYYAPPPPPPVYYAPPPPPVYYAPPPAVVYPAPGWVGPAKQGW